jgi:capsular exopolysaccharide synthesis family protein
MTFTATPIYRAKAVVQIEQPSGFVLRTDIFGVGFTRTLPQEQAEMLDTYPYKALVDSIVTITQYSGLKLSQYKNSETVKALFEEILCQNASADDVEGCILARAAQLERRNPNLLKEEEDFEQDVQARLVEDTGLIELFAETTSPRRAQDAANAAALVVVWQNERLRKEEARNTVRFIRNQLESPGGVKEQLSQADEKLASFKEKKQFLDAEEQMRALMLQMVELSNRRWQGNLRLTDLRTRLAATRQQLGREPSTLISPTIYENPTVQEIKKQLVAAEADLLALQAQFTDEHPRVQSALARVHSLRERLRQEATRIESVQRLPNPVHQELYKSAALLSADIVGQEAQMTALEQATENIRRQLLAVPELEKQLTQLLRQRQALEKRYLFLVERLQEAELTQAVKLGNARIVELAQLPGKRVKPRRVLNMLMGTVLGVLLAVGFALLMEQLDRRLLSAKAASDWLNAPLLAVIPAVRGGDTSPMLTEPLAVEAFRHLRTSIRLHTLHHPAQVFMVTSVSQSEGKTFICKHLAESMARSGQRVVLIDADLRQPMQHHLDHTAQSPGLTELLRGENTLEECIHPTSIGNLWLLPSGTLSSDSVELLESASLQQSILQLKDRYDTVLIDAPPAGMFADARVLALHCDAILLVVQPEATLRDEAIQAVETLRTVPDAKLLGIVANKVPVSMNSHQSRHLLARRRNS